MNANQDRNFLPTMITVSLATILAIIVNLWEPRLMIAVWFGISGLGMLAFPMARWTRWGGAVLLVLAAFLTIMMYLPR